MRHPISGREDRVGAALDPVGAETSPAASGVTVIDVEGMDRTDSMSCLEASLSVMIWVARRAAPLIMTRKSSSVDRVGSHSGWRKTGDRAR